MDENNNLELRSEKIRNIIGEIPPRLVRTGTAVIMAVVVIVAVCAWLVKIDGKPFLSLIFRI